MHANRLRSGNTVVLSAAREAVRVMEVEGDGRVVSESFVKGAARRISVVLPLVALGFDCPRPRELNLATSIPYRIKGLKSQDALVRFASTYLSQQLGPTALPAATELIDALDDPEERVRS